MLNAVVCFPAMKKNRYGHPQVESRNQRTAPLRRVLVCQTRNYFLFHYIENFFAMMIGVQLLYLHVALDNVEETDEICFGEDIETAIKVASLDALHSLFGIQDNLKPLDFGI